MPDPKIRFTPKDHREARKLGISLEDPLDGHQPAVERLYNTLTTAYQRLDDECAHVHRAHRDVCRKLDETRAQVRWLICVLIVLLGLALGEAWVIGR
jgi:hypothetical protein